MRLAQVWLDDPDKQYKKVIKELDDAFDMCWISGAERDRGRVAAVKCYQQAKQQKAAQN